APAMHGEVFDLVVGELNRPAEALKIASGNIWALGNLIQLLENLPSDRDVADEARKRQNALLRDAAQQKDCDAQTLSLAARTYAADGDLEQAINCFRRALALNYGQTGWHLELAKLLAQANRPAEAGREARICLIQSPHHAEATALLKQIGPAGNERK